MSRRAAFALWALAGALWSLTVLGMLSIGIYVLPFAIAATVLALRRGPGRPAAGLLAGLALPLLWVAWLNRFGPGEHCTSDAQSTECVQMWSPWPFVAAGALLVALAVLLSRRPRPR